MIERMYCIVNHSANGYLMSCQSDGLLTFQSILLVFVVAKFFAVLFAGPKTTDPAARRDH